MSASLYYRVVKPPEGSLRVSAPSSFIGSMQRAFGTHPWRLTIKDCEKLEGMAAVYDDSRYNPFHTMLNQIRREDGTTCEIEVWAEY